MDEKSLQIGIQIGIALNKLGVGRLSEITVTSGIADFIELPAEGYYGIGRVLVKGDANLLAENIKYGVSILGVDGSYAPADPVMGAVSQEITANGEYTIQPPSGCVGISRLALVVDVPQTEEVIDAVFQALEITPGAEDIEAVPGDGYNALSSVLVKGDGNLVAANIRKGITIFGVAGSLGEDLQSKSVTPGRLAQRVEPDNDVLGLSSVYVVGDSNLIAANIREGVTIFGVAGNYSTGQVYQTKEVTPGRYDISVTTDEGYNAMVEVLVKGDSNLVPGKIAAGAKIFGVEGTYESPMKPLTVIPSLSEQLILPGNGFVGFSSVTVAPAEATGDYNEGFAAGAASRDAEVAELEARIQELTAEAEAAYQDGYDEGYALGAAGVTASYTNLDEEEF